MFEVILDFFGINRYEVVRNKIKVYGPSSKEACRDYLLIRSFIMSIDGCEIRKVK